MSDPRDDAIAALEDYLRRYPSGNFAELAQVRLDRLLALKGEGKVLAVNAVGNPFTAGTLAARTDYQVGDRYEYDRIEMYTNIRQRHSRLVVTTVSDHEVVYNGGRFITDLIGNGIRRADGRRWADNQNFPVEYFVGERWTTRYRISEGDAERNEVVMDYKIVGREKITLGVGAFDAFRIEGAGYETLHGRKRTFIYWAAPDRVRRFIAREAVYGSGRRPRREREELTAFFEASQPR